MTVYHSIVIHENSVTHRSTTDVEKAEREEFFYRAKRYNVSSFGDINGHAYVVVYEHPKFQEERDRKIEEIKEKREKNEHKTLL